MFGRRVASRPVAVIHRAQIVPSKAELIADWLPSQPWGSGSPLEALGAYRFDDPAGEVGIETHLVRTADGAVLQVPLTYRGAPLAGAEHHLLGTMEHSHLGRRWVYDGCGDPVYLATVAAVISTGGREAEEWVETDGAPVRRDPTVRVTGSGMPGTSVVGVDGLVVVRRIGPAESPEGAGTLTGTWPGQAEPALLAYLG
jgi:hypothetical protein